ncbi:DNA-3-methyladenine glycosylase [Dactylosporangium sp. NPDC049140]|uniref:DNA-3-methyladenine glycosylase family protein n=1 Tax=Dactylosporangium sp. NPDC049140 TaxID=3155647 RepID=UPI0033FDE1B3
MSVAVDHLRKADPRLGRAIKRLGPLETPLRGAPDVFAMLAEAIVFQQLSGKAAATVFGRLVKLCPGPDGYPGIEAVLGSSDEDLRGCGMSRAKVLALRDLAERADSGELPTLDDVSAMDDEAIVTALTKVRGIGRWSAEMFLIFRLGRPDVLPVGDLGVRKGASLVFGTAELPSPAELTDMAEPWRPYRTMACHYLWRAVEVMR